MSRIAFCLLVIITSSTSTNLKTTKKQIKQIRTETFKKANELYKFDQTKNKKLYSDSNECKMDMLSHYIFSPSIKEAVSPTQNMLSICPNLKNACCSESELESLYKQTKGKIDSLDRMIEKLNDLVINISKLTKDQVNNLSETLAENECFPTDGATIDSSYAHILLSKGKFIENATFVIKHFSRLSSSFVCSLCDQKNGEFFVINSIKEEPKLLIDIHYCKEVLKINGYLKILIFFIDFGSFDVDQIADLSCATTGAAAHKQRA